MEDPNSIFRGNVRCGSAGLARFFPDGAILRDGRRITIDRLVFPPVWSAVRVFALLLQVQLPARSHGFPGTQGNSNHYPC